MLNSRRDFIKTTAFAAGFVITATGGFSLLFGDEVASSATRPFLWFDFNKDGSLTLYSNKCEMGQGIFTGFAQIVADELEFPFEKVHVVNAPVDAAYADPVWKRQLTGGSTSIKHMYTPLRQAAGVARESLKKRGSELLKCDATGCKAELGFVVCKKSHKKISYGEIVAKTKKFETPKEAKLKSEKDFHCIGKSMPRVDLPEKISGKAKYVADISLPNMLYAAIIPSKAYGAKVVNIDDGAAKKIKGYVASFAISQGAAVIATSSEAAFAAKAALKVEFGAPTDAAFSTKSNEAKLKELLKQDGVVAKQKGEAKGGKMAVSSTFELPYLYHATMEPLGAVVSVNENGVDIWAATQGQSLVKSFGAKVAGVDESKMRVNTTYLGGGFGRKSHPDAVLAAVEISLKAKAPIKLQYEREDDIKFGKFRPATASMVEASLDEHGMISEWKHKIAAPSVFEHAGFGSDMKVDPAAVEGVVELPYETKALQVNYVKADSLAPVYFWRSVGSTHNAYVVECFMDELAAAAKTDPLEFRLKHLSSNKRAQNILKLAAQKIGWGKSKGLGIAYHYCFGSHAVQAVQISLDKKSGKIKVEKVVTVLDIGPLNINPDILRAQAEGCVIMGISACLLEKVELEGGGVASSSFGDYPILRCSETPSSIEVYTIKSEGEMGGVGEPPLPPVAPAIANAFFALTGKMPHKLPLTEDEVKKLLS